MSHVNQYKSRLTDATLRRIADKLVVGDMTLAGIAREYRLSVNALNLQLRAARKRGVCPPVVRGRPRGIGSQIEDQLFGVPTGEVFNDSH